MSTANGSPTERAARADVKAITRALACPFQLTEVRFKPQVVQGNRAMALAYVDVRVIQDRLDEVLGVEGWQDEYQCLPDGSVICRLKLKLGEEWVTKMDVGGPSEQPDGGDRLKAAFSDALKRAAVKFGIGRYLYRLPVQWVDWDPQRRQFLKAPTLPAFALPPGKKEAPTQKEPAPAPPKPAPKPIPKPAARTTPRPAHALPADGAELQRRLQDYESKLTAQGLCEPGALIKHITQAGAKAGHPGDLTTWADEAIALAVDETKAFEAQARQRQGGKKRVA